jgi:DNA-binding MarR family transcriptional regulator
MNEIETLDAAIGILVRILTIDERRLSSDIERTPLNPIDLETLSYLHRHPGSVAKSIAAYLGVRSTTMQSVVDRLQKRGLLIRDKTALRGRAVALFLTEEGTKFRQQMHAQNLNNCRRMLACVAENERRTFIHNLTKIAAAFSDKLARQR